MKLSGALVVTLSLCWSVQSQVSYDIRIDSRLTFFWFIRHFDTLIKWPDVQAMQVSSDQTQYQLFTSSLESALRIITSEALNRDVKDVRITNITGSSGIPQEIDVIYVFTLAKVPSGGLGLVEVKSYLELAIERRSRYIDTPSSSLRGLVKAFSLTVADYNECAVPTNFCPANSICTNLPAQLSYKCECVANYTWKENTCWVVCSQNYTSNENGTKCIPICIQGFNAAGNPCGELLRRNDGWPIYIFVSIGVGAALLIMVFIAVVLFCRRSSKLTRDRKQSQELGVKYKHMDSTAGRLATTDSPRSAQVMAKRALPAIPFEEQTTQMEMVRVPKSPPAEAASYARFGPLPMQSDTKDTTRSKRQVNKLAPSMYFTGLMSASSDANEDKHPEPRQDDGVFDSSKRMSTSSTEKKYGVPLPNVPTKPTKAPPSSPLEYAVVNKSKPSHRERSRKRRASRYENVDDDGNAAQARNGNEGYHSDDDSVGSFETFSDDEDGTGYIGSSFSHDRYENVDAKGSEKPSSGGRQDSTYENTNRAYRTDSQIPLSFADQLDEHTSEISSELSPKDIYDAPFE